MSHWVDSEIRDGYDHPGMVDFSVLPVSKRHPEIWFRDARGCQEGISRRDHGSCYEQLFLSTGAGILPDLNHSESIQIEQWMLVFQLVFQMFLLPKV